MSATTSQRNSPITEGGLHLADVDGLRNAVGGRGGSWFASERANAIAHFAENGVPTARDEAWRHTHLTPLKDVQFSFSPPMPDHLDIAACPGYALTKNAANLLVFVNGRFSEAHSRTSNLPAGVAVTNLARAAKTHPEVVERHLAQYASSQEHAFVALNTAFMEDGAFVYVPANVTVEEPIHLAFVAAVDGLPSAVHPRNLIVAEANSRVTVSETYSGLNGDIYLTNGVTEVVAAENANVDHYKIQQEGENAFHLGTVQVHQGRDSRFSNHALSLGGRLARNDINTTLDGEGGECTLNGLYLPCGGQHIDTHTQIDHAKPHCHSFELYKGILDGKATGVFNGKILVREDAQKTDAVQSNHSLLLTKEAKINTRPQLEIFADDVKCTHGATIGQLDEESIFYMRSRGIGREQARGMMIAAFAAEIADRIECAPVSEHVRCLAASRFQ